jgi:hydroxyacylglutathione hydrolase
VIIERFFEPLIAQNSYLVGCSAAGDAIVIDANRDLDRYLAAAAAHNVRITHVTETHIHADFLSGSRELAARTGATLLLSDEGDADWKYAFIAEGRPLHHGDRIAIGNVSVEVCHTPGHTPEHLAFLITDGAAANLPIAAATGDFLFVGDVGRPDLLERAVRQAGTMETSARTLYRSLQAFNGHEEWLQIWPGHGAGSSCGKGISAVPYSTLGYERRFNWAFNVASEDEFVRRVLEGQPDPPPYFAEMKRQNKSGPAPRGTHAAPPRTSDDRLPGLIAEGAVVIDARPASEYGEGFLPGTINLPLGSSFVTWAGWLVPYDRDVYVILGDAAVLRLPELRRALSLIGLDRLSGFFGPSALERVSSELQQIPQLAPRDLAAMRGDRTPVVVDVRNDAEWAQGHLPAAIHLPLGHLRERLRELPRDQPLVTQCQAGARSAIAASLLRREGFSDVSNLAGGYDAWRKAGFPTTE